MSRFATTYRRLMRIAETEPTNALEEWLTLFPLGKGISAVTLERHFKAVSRVAAVAREHSGSDALPRVEALFASALARIEEAGQSAFAPSDTGYTIGSSEGSGARSSGTPHETQCPADTALLGELSSTWLDDRWELWVLAGLRAVAAHDPSAHLAFPPLRLYPGDRLIEQLAAVLLEGSEFGLLIRERVIQAVVGLLDLEIGEATRPETGTLLWRLLEQLRPKDGSLSTARSYLARAARAHVTLSDELLRSMSRYVCGLDLDISTRAAFLETLATRYPCPHLVAMLAVCLLNEAVAEPDIRSETMPVAAAQAKNLIARGKDVAAEVTLLLAEGALEPVVGDVADKAIRTADDLLDALDILCHSAGLEPVASYQPPEPTPLPETGVFELAD